MLTNPESNVYTSGVERTFSPDEFLVSKTNLKGHIVYVNRVFMRLSGYREDQLLGSPQSIIRHPGMPRCIYKLLWERIQSGREIFAYLVNRSQNGDHYWVFAHVTPSFNGDGTIIGYHSNRRYAHPSILESTIIPLYEKLLAEENRHTNRKNGMNNAYQYLFDILNEKGLDYDEFVFSLKS